LPASRKTFAESCAACQFAANRPKFFIECFWPARGTSPILMGGFQVGCKGNALVSRKGATLKQGPRVAELALPKSIESGNLGFATVVVRWMSVTIAGGRERKFVSCGGECALELAHP